MEKEVIYPLVSIIIPVYRVEKYLENSVLSVVDQGYQNTEIILVDDGSPDSCPQLCDELADRYANVRTIHQINKGLSGARNTGIRNISPEAKYILFLDSDDKLCVDAVENMVKIAEEHNSDMVIPNRYIRVDELTGKQEPRCHFPANCYYHDPIKYALEVILGQGRGFRSHSLLYRASCIVDNQVEFPEGYTSEDIVFNLRLMPYLTRLDFYDKPTVYYLIRMGSITNSFDKKYFETLWYINDQAKQFLINLGLENDAHAVAMQENLLCRNIVVYAKKIVSRLNTGPMEEKRKFALEVLRDPRLNGVFKKKRDIPYFQSGKARLFFRIMFFLLRREKYELAVSLATLFR